MKRGDAGAAQSQCHKSQPVRRRDCSQGHAEPGQEQPGWGQPGRRPPIGPVPEYRLDHRGRDSSGQHQPGDGGIRQVLLGQEEGQHHRHCPLVDVVEQVPAGQHGDQPAVDPFARRAGQCSGNGCLRRDGRHSR